MKSGRKPKETVDREPPRRCDQSAARRRGGRRIVTIILTAVACWMSPASAVPTTRQVAVIVHPSNDVGDLSLAEIRRIFRLDRQRWSDGSKIYLLMQEEGSEEKAIVLERVFRMSSDQLKRFWLEKIYRGEMTAFPKTLHTNESIRLFVSRTPNAIGFIDAGHSTREVKVLRIEGKLPGTRGYSISTGNE